MTQNKQKTPIFVFGSNFAGRHGKGAALFAKQKHGAIEGVGEGLQGNSYAIPTKDGRTIKNLGDPRSTLSIREIKVCVDTFIEFAKRRDDLLFNVTPIGCGLAGYKHEQIAPLFERCIDMDNVVLPEEFLSVFMKSRII
jgi:hypothetical protein